MALIPRPSALCGFCRMGQMRKSEVGHPHIGLSGDASSARNFGPDQHKGGQRRAWPSIRLDWPGRSALLAQMRTAAT